MCLQNTASNIDFAQHGLQILQAVMDLSPLSVVITDSSGCIRYANPAFELATGYQAEEVLGQNPRLLKSGLMDERVYADLWSRIRAGNSWTGRLLNRRKNGSIYCESTTISPLCAEDGTIHHYIAMKQDITTEMESVETAQLAQDLVDRLAEQSGSVAWEVDDTGLFTQVSQACPHVWAYPAEQLVGERHITDLIVKKQRREMRIKLANIARRKESVVDFICQMVTGKGDLRWVKTTAVPIFDRDGRCLGYSGISMDVTDLKENERLLQDSRAAIHRKLEMIFSPHVELDSLELSDLIDLDATRSMLESLWHITGVGIQITDAKGMLLLDVGWNETLELHRTTHPRTQVAGQHDSKPRSKPDDAFTLVPRADGLWVICTPILLGDTQFGAILIGPFSLAEESEDDTSTRGWTRKHIVAHQAFYAKCFHLLSKLSLQTIKLARVSERQKCVEEELQNSTRQAEELAEKAEAAARAKSEFLAVMSHELRTPLNSVLGFAELLSVYDMDEQQQQAVAAIRESGDHLLAVVNDILDFSGIELGGVITATPNMICLTELVDFCGRSMEKQVAAKGLEFQLKVHPDVPTVIYADGRRTRQILLNLLGNAVKFTDTGVIRMEVSLVREGTSRTIDFAIQDSGMGISPEKFGLLFQPFSQIDMTHHRQFQGTGLGLVISQRLAHAMGGSIRVASVPGKGSTFTFRLALAQHSEEPVTDSVIASNGILEIEPTAPRGLAPVLVVEDDDSNGLLASLVLTRLGYPVQVVKNGLEAVHAFATGEFSLILMDMQMPVMDGLKAARTIRYLETGTKIPIIALTASVLPEDRQRCLDSGMDAFLGKPFKIADLAELLNQFIPLPNK